MKIDVATVCSGCGKPTKAAVKGRCPDCAPAHELDRKHTREEREPWSRLYSLALWKRCRALVFERDDHRCRLRLSRRCKPRGPRLRAHHSPTPARELWVSSAGVWERFLEVACDPAGVVTACEPCHALDDAQRREAA